MKLRTVREVKVNNGCQKFGECLIAIRKTFQVKFGILSRLKFILGMLVSNLEISQLYAVFQGL